MRIEQIGRGLARAFLDGTWEPTEMAERGRICVGLRDKRRIPVWLRDLTLTVIHEFPGPTVRPAIRAG